LGGYGRSLLGIFGCGRCLGVGVFVGAEGVVLEVVLSVVVTEVTTGRAGIGVVTRTESVVHQVVLLAHLAVGRVPRLIVLCMVSRPEPGALVALRGPDVRIAHGSS